MQLSHLTLVGLLAVTSSAHALTAWLPEPGTGSITGSLIFSSFDSFLVGNAEGAGPLGGSIDKFSTYAGVEYGLTSHLALDVSTGYSWVTDDAFTALKDNGLDDSRIGLRLGLTQDEGAVPALALRVGGIIAGTYEVGAPYSIGDGANGGEASLLFAKRLGDSGFSILGDVGYRIRGDDVPDDFFFSAGVAKSFELGSGGSINLYAGYRQTDGQSGGDIGGPGFGSSFGFPQVREEQQGIDFSVGYSDSAGRTYSVGYGHVIDGRNTPNYDVFSLSVSVPF